VYTTELARERELQTHAEHRLFGFLLGSVIAGAGLYYYVIDEYKVSNELLTEDIYVSLAHSYKSRCIGVNVFPRKALQAAVQRIEKYVSSLEEEVKAKK
jgi:hypothetical protein